MLDKAKLIRGVERLKPFDLGDDPYKWGQLDTIARVLELIEQLDETD